MGLITISVTKIRQDSAAPTNDYIYGHLFEGQTPGESYRERSLQKVARQAARAGIRRPVALHMRRYSCATHLPKAGTDIRIIQDLPGHASIKITEIYPRVAQHKRPASPFDGLAPGQQGRQSTSGGGDPREPKKIATGRAGGWLHRSGLVEVPGAVTPLATRVRPSLARVDDTNQGRRQPSS